MTQQQQAEWWERFSRLLDEQNEWPATYMFKFIVPLEQMPAFQTLFAEAEIQTRASSQGNYISVTMTPTMESAEAVREIYEKAGQLPGIVLL